MSASLPPAGAPGGGVRVLVVDDAPEVRAELALLVAQTPGLTLAGVARTGVEAILAAERARPDVVVMDVRMPVLDGLTAARRIVARWPRVGVLMHSAYDDPALVDDAGWAGAHGYLGKGSSSGEVVAAIRECAAARRGLPATAAEADLLVSRAAGGGDR